MKYNCGIVAEDSTENLKAIVYYCDEIPWIPIRDGKPIIKVIFKHSIDCQCSSLKNQILERFPLAKVKIDVGNSTYIDIQLGPKFIVVEYNPNKGFGVSKVSDSYGEGPDKIFSDASLAFNEIIKLLSV